MRPFLYVAGLFRSGTTLVQELLTQKGKSFIFHEPRFGDGWWQFEEHDRRFLRECWGLSLPKFTNIGDTWSYFQNDLGLQALFLSHPPRLRREAALSGQLKLCHIGLPSCIPRRKSKDQEPRLSVSGSWP